MLAGFLDVDPRRIGRVGDVDDDRRVRLQRERGRARAPEGRLLLRHRHGSQLPVRAAGLGNETRRVQRHERAEAVVERARDEPPVGELRRLRVDHCDVADPHPLARLIAVARADVDVQLADVGDLLAVLLAQEMDRLLADHARDGAAVGVEDQPLADEDLGVPATDRPKPQVALVVDVGHDQPDLIDVSHD